MPARRRSTLAAATAGAAAGILLVTAAPAVAGGAAPTPYVHGTGGVARKADAGSGVAGHVASLDGRARRTASATVNVPAVTCLPRDGGPLFVTLGLFGNVLGPSEEFTYVAADLVVTCTQGVPFYAASVIRGDDRQTGAVSPGDLLQVKLSSSAGGAYATITDKTTGGIFRVEGPGLEPTTVQASVQGGFADGRFPKFDTVRFSGVKVDGAVLSTFSPTSFDQVSTTGSVLLQTSPLDASGQNFRVTYRRQP